MILAHYRPNYLGELELLKLHNVRDDEGPLAYPIELKASDALMNVASPHLGYLHIPHDETMRYAIRRDGKFAISSEQVPSM